MFVKSNARRALFLFPRVLAAVISAYQAWSSVPHHLDAA